MPHAWLPPYFPRAVEKVVAAHSTCRAKAGPKRQELTRERTTLERRHAVHGLLDNGVGLLDCARRPNLTLNTVKRNARVPEPDRLRRPSQYRACLVDPYRDHLRRRRTEEPGVPVKHLFEEIRALGYSGSLNLLHKYLNQGLLQSDRIMPSPRRLSSWIMTCPEMTALARLVRGFAQLMAERRGPDPDSWVKDAREAALPELGSFLNGLGQDHDAVVAGLTLPYSNGPAEGVNTKTKLIARQMYGRAGFPLLRHRILLG